MRIWKLIESEIVQYWEERKSIKEKKERSIEEKKIKEAKVDVFNNWKDEEKFILDENVCEWFLKKLNAIGDLYCVSMYGSRLNTRFV